MPCNIENNIYDHSINCILQPLRVVVTAAGSAFTCRSFAGKETLFDLNYTNESGHVSHSLSSKIIRESNVLLLATHRNTPHAANSHIHCDLSQRLGSICFFECFQTLLHDHEHAGTSGKESAHRVGTQGNRHIQPYLAASADSSHLFLWDFS